MPAERLHYGPAHGRQVEDAAAFFARVYCEDEGFRALIDETWYPDDRGPREYWYDFVSNLYGSSAQSLILALRGREIQGAILCSLVPGARWRRELEDSFGWGLRIYLGGYLGHVRRKRQRARMRRILSSTSLERMNEYLDLLSAHGTSATHLQICALSVDPGHRRQGIASQLLDEAIARAPARARFDRVVTNTWDPEKRRIYERMGFEVDRHSVGRWGIEAWTLVKVIGAVESSANDR